ncbi:low temperature requirement protein A [Micromonospora sp. DT44]|uniref:low temperature requirement protein A n=1 Tax=Micromonospora sp. DT44 TaxID=3393439 RepID=UPI003CF5B2F1
MLVNDLTLEGGFEALVLLLALWWVWILTAWMTDQFDPQHAPVQWYVVLVMFGVFLRSQLGPAINTARDPHRLSQWSAYAHMTMVAGTLLAAVGFTLAMDRPTAHTPAPWIAGIIGGPALFLLGRVGFEYVIFGSVRTDAVVSGMPQSHIHTSEAYRSTAHRHVEPRSE